MGKLQMLATLALGTLLSACAGDQITAPSPQPSGVRIRLICSPRIDPNAPPPLYVVDGERLAHDKLGARQLRPEDIESVEVLKGPAAVAQFGPAAEHGVLLIRTRSGSDHARTH